MPSLALALGLPFTRPSGSSFAGPLDAYTSNLAIAISFSRRLLSSYTGPLIRVRADRTGQPEEDIGFLANGDIDEAALLTFAGSDNAYVVTAYRQDGSANDATQATAAEQPLIVSGAAMLDGPRFIGSQFFQISSVAASEFTDGSNVQVVVDAALDGGYNARTFSFNTDEFGAYLQYSGTLYWDAPTTGGRISGSQPAGYNTGYHITSLERAGTASKIRIDGTEEVTGTVGSSISGTSNFIIGALSSGVAGIIGNLRSFVIWKDCTAPATRAALLT